MMMQLTGSMTSSRVQPAPKMPPGLVELMEGMTREVLKHNPTDVYGFCAKHMEQLLIIRDGKAPKRYKLTLEEKIKRAQEKVRENAEQRRRLYDETMKKMYAEAKTDSSANEETKPGDIIANMDQEHKTEIDSPVPLEENSLAENVLEGKLKAPVHHEKELTETLEVEIFHKPLENVDIKNESPEHSKDKNQSKQVVQASDEMRKSTDEIDKEDEQSVEAVIDGTKSKTNTVGVLHTDDLKSEPKMANENLPELHEQVRVRRSVDDNDYAEIEADTNITKESKTKTIEENSEIDINETKIYDVAETKVINVSFAEVTNNPNIEGQDTKNLTNETLDNAATFANEITESVTTPENFNLEVEAKTSDESDTTELSEKYQSKSEKNNESSLEKSDEVTYDEKENKGDTNVVNKQIETRLEQLQQISEKSIEESLLNNGVKGVQEKTMVFSDIKKYSDVDGGDCDSIQKDITRQLNIENGNVVEPNLNGDITAQDATEVIEQELVKNDSQLEVNGKIGVEQKNGEGLPKETEVTVENVSPSEESITMESSPKNDVIASSGPSENIERKPSIKCPEASNLLTMIETQKENLGTNQKPDIDESTNEEITTVDKILVESVGLKDDNDSAPVATAEHETKLNQGIEHMNGTHLNNEVIENGSETPEPSIPHAETLKVTSNEIANSKNKDANVLDVLDNASIASEPAKTETSSMEEPSSMEENILDEGMDNIIEVEEVKSSPESAKDKENENTMDLETAAITIQKVFRSFLFKRSTFDDTGIEGANSIDEDSEKMDVQFSATSTPINKERRTLGISRMDSVLQTVNEEKSLSLSTDDSSLSSAATIIQAHIRGFLVRNKLSSNRTNSASLGKSEGPSTSFEAANEQKINKTVLNIHIVPEGENFLSRDESLLTSMELSLDGSPPSSTKLHPLGYDKSEPRKQLKREDAIQSISPPSNNSGKLSEDVDSVKDISDEQQKIIDTLMNEHGQDAYTESGDNSPTKSTTIETVIEAHKISKESESSELEKDVPDIQEKRKRSLVKAHSDESDVVCEDKGSTNSDNTFGLLHSGEFHDIVLPTKVYRADTSVVREFKNVLVYFLLWNNAS